jgi:hypothetical protein
MGSKKIETSQLLLTPVVSVTNVSGKFLDKVVMANKLQVGVNHESFKKGLSVYGGVVLNSDSTPDDTSNRLYNEAGSLKFNGEEIKGGGGGTANAGWLSGSQIIYTTGSLGIKTHSPDRLFEINMSGSVNGIRLSWDATAGDASDYAEIIVGDANGSLKLSTVDSDGTSGHISLEADGNIYITASNGLVGILTSSVGINTAHPKTSLVDIQDYNTVSWTTQLSDGESGGHIIKIGAGTTTVGQLYHLTASAGGTWSNADASAPGTGAYNLLGVAMGSSPTSDGMLLRGYARVSSTLINGTVVAGAPVYVSPTANNYTFSRPGSPGEFVRIIGYCLAASGGDVLLYFNPDPTWVDIS